MKYILSILSCITILTCFLSLIGKTSFSTVGPIALTSLAIINLILANEYRKDKRKKSEAILLALSAAVILVIVIFQLISSVL